MQSTPWLPLLPGPLWSGVVAPDSVLSIDQMDCEHLLNWIACNRTILTIKLRGYGKLNCFKYNYSYKITKLCTYAKLDCLK